MKQPMKPIDKALKDYYAEKELSEEQLDRLMALQTESDSTQLNREVPNLVSNKPFTKTIKILTRLFQNLSGYRIAAYATTCVLLIGLILLLNLFNQTSLTQRVMDEIAYNHRQEMPVEVAANSISVIGQYLNRLSFSLISPQSLAENGWQLIGGRYCSINGKLAAQLKVRNISENKVYTLYQASTEGKLVQPDASLKSSTVNGVKVLIWSEQGLLLGLASSL